MRILLTTWGSRGDLNPFLELGTELQRRGHQVTIAASPPWRRLAEKAGFRFADCGPSHDTDDVFADERVISSRHFGLESMAALMELAVGPKMPGFFETLRREASHHDLLVSHHFVFAARMVHELEGIPWVSVVLAPGVMPSAEIFPKNQCETTWLGPLGRLINRSMWAIGRRLIARVVDPPVNRFRQQVGLPAIHDMFFSGTVSPRLHLLMYSPTLAPPCRDWPRTVRQTGFLFYDELEGFKPPEDLQRFLASGSPPWLFTLGTAAVMTPGEFYRLAVAAAGELGERVLLLTGRASSIPPNLPSYAYAAEYLPYAWAMPRCCAVAHQCGAGTTAQALRAGLATLAVPFAFDQPGNARLLQRLGVAELVPPHRLSVPRLVNAMRNIRSKSMAGRAQALGQTLSKERGLEDSCDQIEACLAEPGVVDPIRNPS